MLSGKYVEFNLKYVFAGRQAGGFFFFFFFLLRQKGIRCFRVSLIIVPGSSLPRESTLVTAGQVYMHANPTPIEGGSLN